MNHLSNMLLRRKLRMQWRAIIMVAIITLCTSLVLSPISGQSIIRTDNITEPVRSAMVASTTEEVSKDVYEITVADDVVIIDINEDNNNVTTVQNDIMEYEYYNIPLSEEVQRDFIDIARKYDIPEEILFAIAYCESGYNVGTISSQGAQGMFQIMPLHFSTIANREGISVDSVWNQMTSNPEFAADCAAKILVNYTTWDMTSWHQILMRYNMGPGSANSAMMGGTNSTWYSNKVLDYAVNTLGMNTDEIYNLINL